MPEGILVGTRTMSRWKPHRDFAIMTAEGRKGDLMAEVDPIADNQTAMVVAELMTRKEGDVTLSHAVAALLIQSQKQAQELQDIRSSLWSPDALNRRIDVRHEESCRQCPARQYYESLQVQERKRPSMWQILLSKDALLILVIVLFALMSIYVIIGKDGYDSVTGTVNSEMRRE